MFIPAVTYAGLIEIERIWVKGDTGYALITYTNDSEKTFTKQVVIKCTAIGQDGKKININSETISCDEVGPIKPGFEETIKISIELFGVKMKSIRCSCREQ